MKVKVKKLNENAVMPKKAHPTDAGFDLVATSVEYDKTGSIVYGTGLAFEIPEGYVGLVFPRSSIYKQDLMLTNAVGVIDSGYRGEVMAKFKAAPYLLKKSDDVDLYTSKLPQFANTYHVGERIAQLVIMPIPEIEFEEAEELTDTDRGTGGYGSTGK